jgi:F-type H+-transporting ATPase subunit gamma
MSSLRAIRRRINSIRTTQQITKAMKMISAVKLRRAQEKVVAARPYAHRMAEVISRLAIKTNPEAHPLLSRRPRERTLLLVITADKGLCGSFNSNIIKKNMALLEGGQGEFSLVTIGKKGASFFRKRNVIIKREYIDLFRSFSYKDAAAIGREVKEVYMEGEVDEVIMVYNEFGSAMQQRVTTKTLLPLAVPPLEPGKEEELIDYIYEPSASQVLEDLLNRYIEVQIYHALLESSASEHGARMTAMDAATQNASEMLDRLTLLFNKARQAAITKELIEVVSGADALKG